jgi:hypothetical protein
LENNEMPFGVVSVLAVIAVAIWVWTRHPVDRGEPN